VQRTAAQGHRQQSLLLRLRTGEGELRKGWPRKPQERIKEGQERDTGVDEMKDNLFGRLHDLSVGTGSRTPLAAIERIEDLAAERDAQAVLIKQLVGALKGIIRSCDSHAEYSTKAFTNAGNALAELKGQEE